MRWRAIVMAFDYPGGLAWEWSARDLAAAEADARKWAGEDFTGRVRVVLDLLDYPADQGTTFEVGPERVKVTGGK